MNFIDRSARYVLRERLDAEISDLEVPEGYEIIF